MRSPIVAGLTLLGLLSLPACQGVAAGQNLLGTLQQAAALATQITGWQTNLSGMLGEAQLGKVDEFAKTATSLGGSLKDLTQGGTASSGIQSITGMLGKISSFKAADLLALVPEQRMQKAKELGSLGQQLAGSVQTEINALQAKPVGS